jgi:hypothetical protein
MARVGRTARMPSTIRISYQPSAIRMENPLEVYETLPIVPLRDVVVFPHMMMPFVIVIN